MEVINTQISKENYYNKKGVTLQIDDKQVQANCYGLTLNKEEVRNIVVAILNKLQQDPQTLNIILTKIMIINPQTEITEQNLIEDIQKMITKVQDLEDLQGIAIEVYEVQGNLVQMVIKTEDEYTYKISYETNENAIRIVFDCINPNTSISTRNITFKNLELAKQTSEGKTDTVVILAFESSNGEIYKISYRDIVDSDTVNQSITNTKAINISDSDTTYFAIKLNSVTKAEQEVTIDELTSQNSAIINTYTPEDTTELLQRIVARLQTLYTKKLQVINELGQLQEQTQIIEQQENEIVNEGQTNTVINTITNIL